MNVAQRVAQRVAQPCLQPICLRLPRLPLKLAATAVLLAAFTASGQTATQPAQSAQSVQSAQSAAKPSAAAPTPPPLAGSIASHSSWPVAKPADVESPETLVAALYDVISGPAGKPRDWDRFRSLFLPDGRLAVVRPERPATADQPARAGDVAFLTPELYIERDDPVFKAQGFFEQGIHNQKEEFGNLITVWSTYESRRDKSDAKPFARGVNALTLVRAQGRFWIASIVWDSERPGLALPQKYLP